MSSQLERLRSRFSRLAERRILDLIANKHRYIKHLAIAYRTDDLLQEPHEDDKTCALCYNRRDDVSKLRQSRISSRVLCDSCIDKVRKSGL